MSVKQKKFLSLAVLKTIFLSVILYYAPVYAGKIIERPQEGYILSLPKSVPQNKAMPVLICLPGWGVKAKSDINMWAFAAAKKGFLLAELDVDYTNANSQYDTGLVYARMQNILTSLSRSYVIDKNKIFLAGTSAGGMMSIALILMHPNEFKAAGIISAGRLGFGAVKFIADAKDKPFYFFHGQKDKSIPITEFYATKRTLESSGAKVQYRVIEEGEHTLPTSCYNDVVDWLYKLSQD